MELGMGSVGQQVTSFPVLDENVVRQMVNQRGEQVLLPCQGFSESFLFFQFPLNDARLSPDLSAEQARPRQGCGHQQHHSARQHERMTRTPPRRRLQKFDVVRLAEPQTKGFWFVPLAAFDRTYPGHSNETSRLQCRNLLTRGRGLDLSTEDSLPILKNELWVDGAMHILHQSSRHFDH